MDEEMQKNEVFIQQGNSCGCKGRHIWQHTYFSETD